MAKSSSSLDASQELAVINAIILREGYLIRLKQLVSQAQNATDNELARAKWDRKEREIYLVMPPEMTDVLELLRFASIEVVEAMKRWKIAQRHPDKGSCYQWNGHNYLARMAADLDFLCSFTPLINWLGFDMIRNPFILPQPMQGMEGASHDEMEKIGSYDPACVPMRCPKFKVPKPDPSPYLTPVINDLDLCPPPVQLQTLSGPFLKQQQQQKPKDVAREKLLPSASAIGGPEELQTVSIISEADLLRIKRAEQLILDEEASIGGTYVWSQTQASAPKLVFRKKVDEGLPFRRVSRQRQQHPRVVSAEQPYPGSTVIKPRSSFTSSFPSTSRHAAKASTSDSSNYNNNLEEEEQGEATAFQQEESSCFESKLPMDAPNDLPALKKACKMGNDLLLVTSAGTWGRIKPLARPNRLLRMEMEINHLQVEINALEKTHQGLSSVTRQLQHELYSDSEFEGHQEQMLPDTPRDESYDQDQQQQQQQQQQDDEGSLTTSTGRLRGKLRLELAGAYQAVQSIQKKIDDRKAELAFKKQCKQYLEQVKKMEEDREAKARLNKKRVALSDGEVLPDDESLAISLEDKSAISIQRHVRGMIERAAAYRYRVKTIRLIRKVQAVARGILGRKQLQRRLYIRRAALTIQKWWRAHQGLVIYRGVERRRNEHLAAIAIQLFVRQFLGRRRASYRKICVDCSRKAMEMVDPQHGLVPDDFVELGDYILSCMKDPGKAFPSTALLSLLRLLAVLLATPEKPDVVTHYDLIGSCSKYVINSLELTWSNAMRMLRRANKLLRKLRLLAADPLHCPSSKLFIPQECLSLSAELKANPAFTSQAMSELEKGAKCAEALLTYYLSLEEVFLVQHQFLIKETDCIPIWLRNFRTLQHQRRMVALQVETRQSTFEAARNAMETKIRQGLRYGHEKCVVDRQSIALATSRVQLSQINQALQQLDKELACRDHKRLDRALAQIKVVDRKLNIARQARMLVEAEIEGGGRAGRKAKAKLAGVREAEYRAENALRSKSDELDICLLSNEQHLQQAQAEMEFPDPRTREAAQELGAEECALELAQLQRDAFVASIGGKYYISALQNDGLQTYLLHMQSIASLSCRCLTLTTSLEQQTQVYEKMVHQKDIGILMRDVQADQWDQATPDQEAFEEQEDETCARAEAVVMEEYLPPKIRTQVFEGCKDDAEADSQTAEEGVENAERQLGTPKESFTPVVIVLARDSPQHLKRQVYHFIQSNFHGTFALLGYQGAGKDLDIKAFQSASKKKQHVIAELDIGCTYRTRRSFLAAIFAVKKGLIPSPRCVLLSGSKLDKRGLGTDWTERTMTDDLTSIEDSSARLLQQSISENAYLLDDDSVAADLDVLLTLSQAPTYHHLPSLAFILVMEVVLILLGPRGNLPLEPEDLDPLLVWQAATMTLRDKADKGKLYQCLMEATFDPVRLDIVGSIHTNSLSFIMETYLQHPEWPNANQLSMQDEPAFLCLAQWASNTIQYQHLLLQAGGMPEPVVGAGGEKGLFETSLVVSSRMSDLSDGHQAAEETVSPDQAFTKIAMLIGQDRLEYEGELCRLAGDREDEPARTVRCYRFASRILFTLSNPVNSDQWSICFLECAQVEKLLAPNFTEIDSFKVNYPPKTMKEVYQRLTQLLRFHSVWEDGRSIPRLVCARNQEILVNETRKVGGHEVNITAWEESKGELAFSLTIPALGAEDYVYRCIFDQLMKLYRDGDATERTAIRALSGAHSATEGGDERDENEGLRSTIAQILNPVLNRLMLYPTVWTCADQNWRSIDLLRPAATDTGCSSPDVVLTQNKTLSNLAKLRQGGGRGHVINRKLLRRTGQAACNNDATSTSADAQILVSMYESGESEGPLRVLVYDPMSATTSEIDVPPALRRYLLLSSCTGSPAPLRDCSVAPSIEDEEVDDGREKKSASSLHDIILGKIEMECKGAYLNVTEFVVEKEMSVFGQVQMLGGLKVEGDYLLIIKLSSYNDEECVLEFSRSDVNIIARQAGLDVENLDQRYVSDASYRQQLFDCIIAQVAMRQVGGKEDEKQQLLGVSSYQGREWTTLWSQDAYSLKPERVSPINGSCQASSSSTIAQDAEHDNEDDDVTQRAGPQQQGVSVDACVLKSSWEQRLLARRLIEIERVLLDEEGQEKRINVLPAAEVRIWESFTGGSRHPMRQLRISVIDHTFKEAASRMIIGQTQLQKFLGPEHLELLSEGTCARDLSEFILQSRFRLVVKPMPYNESQVSLAFPTDAMESEKEAKEGTSTFIKDSTQKGFQSLTQCDLFTSKPSTSLILSMSLIISNIPSRLLCYLLRCGNPANGHLIYISINRAQNIRCRCTVSLASLREHLSASVCNAEWHEHWSDMKLIKAIARKIAFFLRYRYDDNDVGLALPYYNIKLLHGQAQEAQHSPEPINE